MRSAEGSETKADCEDPMIKAACLIDDDSCPAECKESSSDEKEDTVVKSGDLAVSAKAADGKKALIGGVSDLDTITFKTSEDVTISSITLERYGYSTIDDVVSVQLEDEVGNIIADAKEPNSKGQVKLNLKKDYKTVDGTFKATVVVTTRSLPYTDQEDPDYNTYKDSKNGSTLGFKVIAAESTAKNLNLDDYSPYTYDLVSYKGSAVQFSSRNSETKDYNFEADKLYEVAKFRVKAPADAAILVKGFTLTDDLGNDIEADKYAKDVTVTFNGKEVSGLKWNINKDEELVISFNEVEVAGKETATIAVNMSFTEEFDNFGESSKYYIKELSNFNAIDKKTETRVSQDETKDQGVELYTVKALKDKMTTYKFNGGKIKIAGSKLGTINAAAGSTNVKVAEGNITISEAIRWSARIEVKDWSAAKIDEIRLVINGEEYDGSKNGNVYTFKGLEIEKSGKVEIRVDVKSEVAGNPVEWNIEFAGSLNSKSFVANWTADEDLEDIDNALLKYDESGKKVAYTEIAGSLSISNIKVQAAKASLENKNTKEVELILNENNRKTIFEGTYEAKKGAVTLKRFLIKLVEGTTAVDWKPTFYVTINGEEYDANWVGGEAKWDIDDIVVADGKTASVKVEIEATPSAGNAIYNIKLEWEDEDNNEAWQANDDTVRVKVVEQGTLNVNASAKNTVLLKSDRSLAEFTIKPSKSSDDDVILKNLSFTLTQWDTDAKVAFGNAESQTLKVVVDGDDISKEATFGETYLTFTPDVPVPAEGIVVKVSLRSEVTVADDDDGARILTLTHVNLPADEEPAANNSNQSRKFQKLYLPAILKITQEKKGDVTKYNIDVEKYDSATTVSGLKFLVEDTNKACTTADSCKVLDIVSDVLSDNDNTWEAVNGDSAKSVKFIQYTIDNADTPVTISRSVYEDYFKVNGGDYLMVFSNK